MDIQLKRGLLDVCVLASIMFKEPYVEISESTLYPILRRLESAEMITVRTAEHNGRLRKYYHIEPAGLERIESFRSEWKEIISIYNYVNREDDEND